MRGDGDGNVYLPRIIPVKSLVRDLLSPLCFSSSAPKVKTLFLMFCAERQVTCKQTARKWKRSMETHRKIAHKRSKLIFNIFFSRLSVIE